MINLLFFTPPEDISYLLYVEEEVAGMGALRNMNKDVGEIKRMFIPWHLLLLT
jgi:hypothetical protein